jgi:hypothetical protein
MKIALFAHMNRILDRNKFVILALYQTLVSAQTIHGFSELLQTSATLTEKRYIL